MMDKYGIVTLENSPYRYKYLDELRQFDMIGEMPADWKLMLELGILTVNDGMVSISPEGRQFMEYHSIR